jgi:hypothetical protein
MELDSGCMRTGYTTGGSLRSGRKMIASAMGTAALALLAGCGSSSNPPGSSKSAHATANLNTARVALAIEQSIMSQRHLHSTVVCPPTIPQQHGLTFTCVATTLATTHHHRRPVRTLFTVFQKDDAGNVYYESPK